MWILIWSPYIWRAKFKKSLGVSELEALFSVMQGNPVETHMKILKFINITSINFFLWISIASPCIGRAKFKKWLSVSVSF